MATVSIEHGGQGGRVGLAEYYALPSVVMVLGEPVALRLCNSHQTWLSNGIRPTPKRSGGVRWDDWGRHTCRPTALDTKDDSSPSGWHYRTSAGARWSMRRAEAQLAAFTAVLRSEFPPLANDWLGVVTDPLLAFLEARMQAHHASMNPAPCPVVDALAEALRSRTSGASLRLGAPSNVMLARSYLGSRTEQRSALADVLDAFRSSDLLLHRESAAISSLVSGWMPLLRKYSE